MDYRLHYDRLIERAKHRSILPGVYFERHHIIPKCLGGSDNLENLVDLFPEEHFVAHQLLVKIYPDNLKLVYATHMMTISTDKQIRNNKLYKWIRNKCSQARKGVPKTDQHKRNMSLCRTGKSNEKIKGIPKTPEHRLKMSKAKLNIPKSEEHREKLASILSNKSQCPHCLKIGRLGPMSRWHFDNCKLFVVADS